MESTNLDLPFKGDRNYLHGTDLVDALVAAYSFHGKLDIQFHRSMTEPVRAVLGADQDTLDRCVAKALLDDKLVAVVSREGEITQRVPYNEGAAIVGCSKTSNSLEVDRLRDFTLIEQVVALNKSLLNVLYPDVGHWFFTKLTASDFPAQADLIAVEFDRSIGTKLFRSKLLFDNAQVGYISFSPVTRPNEKKD